MPHLGAAFGVQKCAACFAHIDIYWCCFVHGIRSAGSTHCAGHAGEAPGTVKLLFFTIHFKQMLKPLFSLLITTWFCIVFPCAWWSLRLGESSTRLHRGLEIFLAQFLQLSELMLPDKFWPLHRYNFEGAVLNYIRPVPDPRIPGYRCC